MRLGAYPGKAAHKTVCQTVLYHTTRPDQEYESLLKMREVNLKILGWSSIQEREKKKEREIKGLLPRKRQPLHQSRVA